jgi:hypothetical protein
VVLLVDTYESLTALDAWLRDEFLPGPPHGTLVVAAGRQPPSPAWRTDPGRRDLVRVVSLPNLRPEESAAYLGIAGVPAALHGPLSGYTHGHPLALALAADVLGQGGGSAVLDQVQAPDVVQTLLQRFVEGVPGPPHRHALQVCAEPGPPPRRSCAPRWSSTTRTSCSSGCGGCRSSRPARTGSSRTISRGTCWSPT